MSYSCAMTAADLIRILAGVYRGAADDEIVSIGHWKSPGIRHPELPDFYADIGVTVGQIRRMAEIEEKGIILGSTQEDAGQRLRKV